MLEGFDFAMGIVSGEQVIERHARGVEILLGAGRRTGEGFGGNIAGRAGQAVGLVAGQARAVGQAEVEHAQFAVVAEQQVLGLDVAVDDIAPVQQAEGLDQARRQVLPVGQAQWAMLLQARGQGLTGIFALHVIQMLALR